MLFKVIKEMAKVMERVMHLKQLVLNKLHPHPHPKKKKQ